MTATEYTIEITISLEENSELNLIELARTVYLQILSRDNFLRRNFHKKLEMVGLGWVNFQVLRRTQATLGHNEGIDPKIAADQRGHAIGAAIDIYTQSDLASRRKAVTKLERLLNGSPSPEDGTSEAVSEGNPGFQGKQGKTRKGGDR